MSAGSGRGHGLSERGGKPVGRRVRLPRGAEPPIAVFINGTEQLEGTDYELADDLIVFREPIFKEDLRELGAVRKIVLGLGLVGSYQRHEVVDVEYRIEGRARLASDLDVIAD
ncbi:MAG: hypothetical protein EDQ89_04425 [Acidobacteria bacterium]|nr:MAG: hypothetical protein EDQ89_04425 [Acidobacteriota bacterium]MCL4287181.1 hypothetical protein [Thermoleophilia bacterium]GIK78801.1 MAG: hypothetical protein BroJett022_24910 [Actinomycetes bacterium]